MKTIYSLLILALFPSCSHATTVFNLNVFDQLQGEWQPGFRERRLGMVSEYVAAQKPAIVVFEEARGVLPGVQGGGEDSVDAALLAKDYPFRKYVHEMTGADGASYGYWIGAKTEPRKWIVDGFSFPGGVERKVLAAVFDHALDGDRCLGVIGLHLSYQNTAVRQKEAAWLLDWLRAHESDCASWLVTGDFNASEKDAEMKLLFAANLNHLYGELKPTVGPFNPIRRIYGADKPNLTIDWALGWNLAGTASVVLDAPYAGEDWVSDHAGVLVELK